MEFNQIINNKNSNTRYFEKELGTILLNYFKSATITILPLLIKSLSMVLLGKPPEYAARVFFSDRDILIILVSVVSSSAFVTYKYLNRNFLCYICWLLVALNFGIYINIGYKRLDMFRGIMWFLISVLFSFSNILLSQYIPKERRS